MMNKKIVSVMLTLVMVTGTVLMPCTAQAKNSDEYLSLGADLSADEKAEVLRQLDIDEDDLGDYKIVEVTNADEHKYLDSYLDASVIGTRALSSAKIETEESGSGIQVTTHNISYCTTGMYQNALATAGMKDADVTVAGPFSISGTAALVGVLKAYEEMTGDVIQPQAFDTATNELVATSALADNIGDSDKAEQLVGAVKEVVAANDLTSEDEILQAIDDVSGQMDIQLSEEDRQKIADLMQKISELNLNVDDLKAQVSGLYDEIQNLDLSKYGISQEEVDGFLDKIGNWFSDTWISIKEWFANLM